MTFKGTGGCFLFLVLGFIVFSSTQTCAQDKYALQASKKSDKLYMLGIESVTSLHEEKNINVYAFRLGYGSFFLQNVAVLGTLDVSGTTGFLTVDTVSNTEDFNAESFGLGTSFLLRWYFVQFKSISLFLDLDAGIRYTFKSFPPKGTKLNFTTRPGFGISIRTNRNLNLIAGLNRFHLSNGQGYHHPNNPAFDGLGFFVGIVLSP